MKTKERTGLHATCIYIYNIFAVREWMLKFYSVICFGVDVNINLDSVGTIIYLGTINTYNFTDRLKRWLEGVFPYRNLASLPPNPSLQTGMKSTLSSPLSSGHPFQTLLWRNGAA